MTAGYCTGNAVVKGSTEVKSVDKVVLSIDSHIQDRSVLVGVNFKQSVVVKL